MSSMMELPYQSVQERPLDIFDERNLIDDSMTEIPTVGLLRTYSLPQRFLDRLSIFIGARTALKEDKNKRSIEITISGSFLTSDKLYKLLDDLKSSLELICLYKKYPKYEQPRTELWNALTGYGSREIGQIVSKLKCLFRQHQDVFEDCITKSFGIDDRIECFDHDLGDKIIKLYHTVWAADGDVKEYKELIEGASDIVKSSQSLYLSLKSLLTKAKLANDLYQLIYNLCFPDLLFETLTRAARASETFRHVTFHVPEAKKVHDHSILRTYANQKKNVSQTSMAPLSTRSSRELSEPPSAPNPTDGISNQPLSTSSQPFPISFEGGTWLDIVQPYLSKKDRAIPLHYLKPQVKVELAHLIGITLRGKILPTSLNAWYTFGFASARNETEERYLGGLYVALIKEASTPQEIFHQLLEAISSNKLVELFDVNEYSHFREIIPDLEDFLTTPPPQRWTVWRLKQFIHADEMIEPPECLQRDYGFWFCRKREEVGHLKAIYRRALNSITPRELHDACRHGRLQEAITVQAGIPVDPRFNRLMKNDYPSAYVGFDNDKGLEKYRGRFFKRNLVS